jgi:hypothetical protein
MLTNNIVMSTEYNTYDTQRKGANTLTTFTKPMCTLIRHRQERKEGLYYLDPNAEHYRLKYSAEESTYASSHNGGY